MERHKKRENISKSEMNQKGQTIQQILGFIVAILGAYLILIALRVIPAFSQLLDFLRMNPIFDNSILFFVGGIALIYLGYIIFSQ